MTHPHNDAHGRTIFRDNDSRGDPQDILNLRPLPNRLGHNGPYIGGFKEPVERDCERIDGHTHLFRSFETFEQDLREAIELVWDEITAVKVASQRLAHNRADPDAVLARSAEALKVSFRFMQEAYLIAEVLDDRQKRRIRDQATQDFLSLIPCIPVEDMSGLDRLAEEGRLTWQISALLERMSYSRGAKVAWPKQETDRLLELTERLEKALQAPTADDLQSMSDAALTDELLTLETRIGDTRRTISLIHAIRLLRKSGFAGTRGN
ncbi:hypothetical protein [Pararhizobium antarcticum]|uniref:Uncharacterized protein n=1 Tax=Pararhizobium antarcticum TaxID=1798805 RepID=A0A657LXC3_9HYPH|nr:hypothetical protein [Pararhizobium antarcticum]OJF91044.1 hypothetical protein AX761_06175 [Rhizobium sp. 58]OJF99973.1 hypothetical protein AX760_11350 [Pararhizobium antarcticum]